MTTVPLRLLVSDVDGTLLTSEKVLTDSTVAGVQRLRTAGIELALTSSRPPPGLGMFVEPLRITAPLGAFNGGVFCRPDLVPIDERPLPDDTVGPLVAAIEARGLDVWVYRAGQWLVRSATAPHVAHESEVVRFTPTVVRDFADQVDGRAVSGVAKVVGVSDDHALVAEVEAEVVASFGDRVSATRSQAYYLDVTHPLANKGAVVDYLARRLQIPGAAVATIGDGQNDTLMFARSGISVAMGNASADVQAAATRVTATNDDDGFAAAVDELLAQPRAGSASGGVRDHEGP